MTFAPPPNALGADLFWWRETGSQHSLVTVYARSLEGVVDDPVLHCVLFDGAGDPAASWQVDLAHCAVVAIDSQHVSDWVARAPRVENGVLAIYVCGTPHPGAADKYLRLYSMLDWYSNADGLSGLHNDQSVRSPKERVTGITEIAALETADTRNSLVIVNGECEQAAGALTVTVTNAGGVSREAKYDRVMAPFTVHQVRLADHFPSLDAFGDGAHLNVGGTFVGRGMYLRPYVITEGVRFSAYHGGDIYRWNGLPAIHYRLLGSGEVNPMAVVHRPGDVETSVNLFNSQGAIEESFWVDAELFDETGKSVARRERWRCARRHALTRGDLQELIPDPARPFTGHIALTFSGSDAPFFPGRLQALLEYRSAGGAARVMAWSDEWNSRIKLHRRAREGTVPLRSYYRTLCGRGFETFVSLTNAGHGGYREVAPCTITLCNAAGGRRAVTREVGPHATIFTSVAELFPDAGDFLVPLGVGVIEVESTFDLANVQFVRHAATGAWAAEHYLALETRDGDRVVMPAGW